MIRAGLLWLVLATPVAALDLQLPANARQTVERNTDPDVYAAPTAPFDGQTVPTRSVEGEVRRAAWRIASPGLTPLQVLRPLRTQLIEAGYEIVLDCAGEACGGFDFRFATEVLPAPNMYVNLRNFHFVTAIRPTDGEQGGVVTVLASTAAASAYVQIIRAGDEGEQTVAVEATGSVPIVTPTDGQEADLASVLLSKGHVVLADLDFTTGSTDLGEGPFASLQGLAEFLQARPELRVALVGHTDTVGGLQPNIGISRARAQSVRTRLIGRYGIDASRLDAEGMGYLAPLASNLDPTGRDTNRRVEAVLLSE
ncbi:MAG: OmpA family protein [Sulfitobacter sp.]|nr:OmpA family protein [Sulfitobacter sp.]